MATEIERKFLVTSEAWRLGAVGRRLVQGYLGRDPERSVRVRIDGAGGFVTIKGKTLGASRAEFEYPIPLADAEAMLQLCLTPLIDKTRYRVVVDGKHWEIDEFGGDNAPLVIAELELSSEDEAFARPPWLGEEVTHDPRYFNSQLTISPYSRWRANG
jgi:adenylate cyclase